MPSGILTVVLGGTDVVAAGAAAATVWFAGGGEGVVCDQAGWVRLKMHIATVELTARPDFKFEKIMKTPYENWTMRSRGENAKWLNSCL